MSLIATASGEESLSVVNLNRSTTWKGVDRTQPKAGESRATETGG